MWDGGMRYLGGKEERSTVKWWNPKCALTGPPTARTLKMSIYS